MADAWTALAAVDRSMFVADDTLDAVDVDAPLPLPCGQTTSQPSLIALMVDAMQVSAADRVLEVGTGYGYQAAVLGRLCAEVWSVERHAELAERARANLARAGVANVHVVTGDGTRGVPEHAPYDAIVVAARAADVPEPLVDQLRIGGRLVLPLVVDGEERCVVVVKGPDGTLRTADDLGPVRFVPLIADP
jgi:protein-L-isoaspartate(D-aspartate) O-methyltransferase